MLGEKIDRRRRELKLSQKQLADRSGLSPQYVNMLIHNQRGQRIGIDAAYRLAKALRVSQKFFSSESSYADSMSRKAAR
ncbi:helix-turn-helix domain-containing protein [Deinococcus humi]|uniref:Transcriptional regulator with XRE-family HTH domain n=1 Tax=Deinococcus humi TaxID=662880 RepID=A0A7W8JWP4_9DEIO|nr:helix-turn-helix transcriptional regulator [Deinococcus humi]MBB5363054.1 transcriptional regulator with XRE-family HTH domain [Deinococcus humi]GGO24929.1 hypothetical protein GCM10008949_14310 [Deinococcus humi]